MKFRHQAALSQRCPGPPIGQINRPFPVLESGDFLPAQSRTYTTQSVASLSLRHPEPAPTIYLSAPSNQARLGRTEFLRSTRGQARAVLNPR